MRQAHQGTRRHGMALRVPPELGKSGPPAPLSQRWPHYRAWPPSYRRRQPPGSDPPADRTPRRRLVLSPPSRSLQARQPMILPRKAIRYQARPAGRWPAPRSRRARRSARSVAAASPARPIARMRPHPTRPGRQTQDGDGRTGGRKTARIAALEAYDTGITEPGSQVVSGVVIDRKPGYKIHQLTSKACEFSHCETAHARSGHHFQAWRETVAEVRMTSENPHPCGAPCPKCRRYNRPTCLPGNTSG